MSEHAAGDGWHSIIGGQVYRGTCFPDLVGQYFYSDYFIQRLWGFRLVNGVAQGDAQLLASNLGSVTHVHSDGLGEMNVLNHSGTLRRIVVPCRFWWRVLPGQCDCTETPGHALGVLASST